MFRLHTLLGVALLIGSIGCDDGAQSIPDDDAQRADAAVDASLFDEGLADGEPAPDEGVTDEGVTDADENQDARVRPEGWTEDTHSNDVPANYEQVFLPEVLDLRIEITPESYAAMQANMTELAGPLGEGGPNRPPPPPELFEACVGLEEGAVCEAEIRGDHIDGHCIRGPFPDLFCAPDRNKALNLLEDDPEYVPVTVRVGDLEWTHVGMRYKGNSSLSFSWNAGVLKLPFRLHFDKYEDDHPEIKNQRFYGFKKLTFASGFNDDSGIRDALMAHVLRGQGVFVAADRFARVTVDFGEGPTYYGLYTMIEDPADAMAKRIFGSKDGNIYKPDGRGAKWQRFDEESFVKKNNKSEGDWSDIRSAIHALNAAQGEQWRADLEAHFDMPGFAKWLAVNSFVGCWDTYGVAPHNYYLFANPETGVLQWVPWDHNGSFKDDGGGVRFGNPPRMDLTDIDDEWPLIRAVMDEPVYRAMYFESLAAVRATVAQPEFMTHIQALHDQIAPHVAAEQPPYTIQARPDGFERSVVQLQRYVQTRLDTAEALLAEEP